MKRPVSIIAQVLLAAAAGWAGWAVGRTSQAEKGQAASASEATMTELTAPPHRPAPAPAGWSRPSWPTFAQPDLSTENALTRRAYEDPGAVVKEVMAQPASAQRNQAIIFLLRGWVARDAVAAAEWLAALDPVETPEMLLSEVRPVFRGATAEAQAKGVLGFLAAKADPKNMSMAAERELHQSNAIANQLNDQTKSLATWAMQEPEQALAWVRARPSAEARQWLMGTLIGALARNGGADQAIALYNAEPDLHEEGAVRSLGKAWAQADPTAALAWSEKIPDASLRDAFIASALQGCPEGQAPELLEFTSHVGDAEARRSLREHLVKNAVWNQSAVREWLEADPSLDDAERGHWRAELEKIAQGL